MIYKLKMMSIFMLQKVDKRMYNSGKTDLKTQKNLSFTKI